MLTKNTLITVAWLPFLLSPYFTTNVLEYFIATDLLAFASALMATACMYILSKPKQYPPHMGSWILLLLFLLPSILHLIANTASNPWGIYRISFYIIAVFLIFRMAQYNAIDFLNSTQWLVLLGITGNIYALVACLQMFHIFPEDAKNLYAIWNHASRFSGALLQPNLSTLFLNIVVASLFIQGIKTSFQKTWWIASILPLAAIIASNSRSGILLLLLLCFTLLILTVQKKQLLYHLIFALTSSFLIALLWNEGLQTIIATETLGSRLYEGSFLDRVSLWYSAFYLFYEHPLIGIGYGNFPSHFADAQAHTLQTYPSLMSFSSASYWAHNLILNFYSEGGVLGGGAILLFLWVIIKRAWEILSRNNPIHSSQFSSVAIIGLIILHGMLSISFFQGFFLSLLGLYLACLFPASSPDKQQESINKKLLPLYLAPALYAAFTWHQFVFIQVNINAVFDDNPDTPRFISEVSKAIDNPWLARAGLEYLLANMELTQAPAHQWVNVYPYIFHSWQLTQDPLSLRRLIIQAHFSDRLDLEKYWGGIFSQSYPDNPWTPVLKRHIKNGHLKHEPLSLH